MDKKSMLDLTIRPAPPDYDPLRKQQVLQERILDRFPEAPVLSVEGETVEQAAQVAYVNAQAVTMELMELLDHVPVWKWWKDNPDADMSLAEYDQAHDGAITEAKYELVDALHFVLNIAIALGMSWRELLDVFHTKQTENFDRQERGY